MLVVHIALGMAKLSRAVSKLFAGQCHERLLAVFYCHRSVHTLRVYRKVESILSETLAHFRGSQHAVHQIFR